MLRQKNNLPDMMRIMQELTIDGGKHSMFLAANEDNASQVLRCERVQCAKNATPSCLPPGKHLLGGGSRLHHKFLVAIAIRFFAIGGQEIGKPGAHVARDMFHDQGNAVGLGIQADEPMLGLQLGKSFFCLTLVLMKIVPGFFEVELGNLSVHRNYHSTFVTNRVKIVPVNEPVSPRAPPSGLGWSSPCHHHYYYCVH